MSEIPLEELVAKAQGGDARALESVVVAIREDVHKLALRFLWHPEDAEDATQDILVRVITKLGGFRGESAFRTWVFRVASNTLITIKRGRAEDPELSFESFRADLVTGLSDEPLAADEDVELSLMLEEVKIGCTTAMLLCLDRPHRLAYVLGEILALDHLTAAEALEISPANYRQRLARARARITGLMRRSCGLFDPTNPCRCRRRLRRAVELGRVDPHQLLFASSREKSRLFPEVLAEIRALDELERAAALYRSHSYEPPTEDIATWLKKLIGGAGGRWAAWT